MKYWIIALFICFGLSATAQRDTTPPFKKTPGWPPIMLTLLDKTQFTSKDLHNQPTIVMYFSPECPHCKAQMDDMIRDYKELDKYQIILATYQPEEEIKSFSTYYQLQRYDNITVGRDDKFLLPPFYRIRNLPYLALYDRKGNLVTTFEGNVKTSAMVKAFKSH